MHYYILIYWWYSNQAAASISYWYSLFCELRRNYNTYRNTCDINRNLHLKNTLMMQPSHLNLETATPPENASQSVYSRLKRLNGSSLEKVESQLYQDCTWAIKKTNSKPGSSFQVSYMLQVKWNANCIQVLLSIYRLLLNFLTLPSTTVS